MKKFFLVLIAVFFGSCVSESANRDNAVQTIIIMTDSNNLIPDFRFKITNQKDAMNMLTSDDNGTITLDAINKKYYNAELYFDVDSFYENEREVKDFHEVYTNEDIKDFITVYLKHKNDREIITYIGDRKIVTVEHNYDCQDDDVYYIKLESRKNYILIYSTNVTYGISM